MRLSSIIIAAAALIAAAPALGNVSGSVEPAVEGSASCASATAVWLGFSEGDTFTRTMTVTVNGAPVAGSTETFVGRGRGVEAHRVTVPVSFTGRGLVAVYAALGTGAETLVAEREVVCVVPTPQQEAPPVAPPDAVLPPPFIGTPPPWPSASPRKPSKKRPPARPRYRCPKPEQVVVIRRIGKPARSVRTCVKPPPVRPIDPRVAG